MTVPFIDVRSILVATGLAIALALPATGQELLPGMELCAECGYFGPTEGEVRSAYVPTEGYPGQVVEQAAEAQDPAIAPPSQPTASVAVILPSR